MSGFSPIDVIKEVKIRPGIYDRKSLEPPRWERRQQLWKEVAQSVTPPNEWNNFSEEEKQTRISEVSNKWKNLRDHFYREVKLIEAGDTNKKRKYIYYDEMQFVRPYIGYKSSPKNKQKREMKESSVDDFKVNDSDIDMDAFLKLNDDEEGIFFKKEPLNKSRSSNIYEKKYKIKKNGRDRSSIAGQQGIIKNFGLLQKKDDGKHPTFKIRESDISFCLSLVQHLRELSGTRKLGAKIDILKVLHKNMYEIEQKSKQRSSHESDGMGDDTEDDDYKEDPLRSRRQRSQTTY